MYTNINLTNLLNCTLLDNLATFLLTIDSRLSYNGQQTCLHLELIVVSGHVRHVSSFPVLFPLLNVGIQYIIYEPNTLKVHVYGLLILFFMEAMSIYTGCSYIEKKT